MTSISQKASASHIVPNTPVVEMANVPPQAEAPTTTPNQPLPLERQGVGKNPALESTAPANLKPSKSSPLQTLLSQRSQPSPAQEIKARLENIHHTLTAGFVSPELEASLRSEQDALLGQAKARYDDIQHTLLAGIVTPDLEQKLRQELEVLGEILATAPVADPQPATTLSTQEIKTRLDEINQTLRAGLMTPEKEAELLTARSELLAMATNRRDDITHTLLAGIVSPELEQSLNAELAILQELLASQ